MIDSKLYTLLKVAELGSFTQASVALNLTQPAVSQHIRALEDELGAKLFERSGNRLLLSKQGEQAVAAAKAMVALYNNLKSDLSGGARGARELNIGITHTVESNRISEVFARYAATNQGVTIKLVTATQTKLKRKLKSYELDLAIMDGTVSDPGLVSRGLDEDKLVLVTSPSHPLADKDFVTIQELKKEKLILRLPGSGTTDMFISSLESRDISVDDFNIILEVDNIATIKDLVRHEYGVSVLAESACYDEVMKKKLAVMPIENLDMERTISIVYAPNFPYGDFIEEIQDLYHSA